MVKDSYQPSAISYQLHLLLSRDLGFLQTGDYEKLAGEVVEVKRMLTSFISKLKADS